MNSKNKLVSIIINCYNGEEFLKETLDSIINQTYKNWEVIFYDNRSTDNSYNIFNSYKDSRFNYYQAKTHTGLGRARINAIKLAKGEYLAFLDCDDLWLYNKLELQIDLFDEERVGIVISNTLFFNRKNKSKILYNSQNYPKEGFVFELILKNYLISLETILFKTEAIKSIKNIEDFDIYNHIFDFVLVLSILITWKLKIKKKVLAKWRVHEKSETFKNKYKFLAEYKLFIKNFPKKNSDIINKEINSWNYFINKTTQYEIIHLIQKNDIIEARKIYKKNKLKNIKLFILYLITFVPFCKNLINLILKYKNISPI